jgi:cell wall-associated NlpC family hydrolase
MRTAVAALLLAALLGALFAAPAGAQSRTHTVRLGENLYRIALRYGVTVAALMQANGLHSDRIRAGQVLRIPVPPLPGPVKARTPSSVAGLAAPPEIGSEVAAPRPVRLRRGPKSYHTTLAIAAQGTVLQVLGVEEPWYHWYQVKLPDGTVGWVASGDLRPAGPAASSEPPAGSPAASDGHTVRGSDLVREAMWYLGVPYIWGGESPRGVDCSGFVYVVFSARMPQLARLRSFDYFEMGVSVDRADLQAGDLVFFTTYAPGPSHVGIYAGDGRFLHASSGARRVLATPMDDPYYAARYLGARRLLNPR